MIYDKDGVSAFDTIHKQALSSSSIALMDEVAKDVLEILDFVVHQKAKQVVKNEIKEMKKNSTIAFDVIRKKALIGSALGTVGKTLGQKLFNYVAMPAGLMGVMSGVGAQGGMQDKLVSGFESLGTNLFSPGKILSNTVSYGVLPEAGSAALGLNKIKGPLGMVANMGSQIGIGEVAAKHVDPIFGNKPQPGLFG